MNRAERRRYMKKGISAEDIAELYNKGMSKGIDVTTSALFSSLALVLRDKWGWGHVRVMRLLRQIDEQYDAINKGYLSIDDVQQTVFEELKIDLR